MNMKTEELTFQFDIKEPKKELITSKLELPERMCGFCGRKTKHSRNQKICLVCGIPDESR